MANATRSCRAARTRYAHQASTVSETVATTTNASRDGRCCVTGNSSPKRFGIASGLITIAFCAAVPLSPARLPAVSRRSIIAAPVPPVISMQSATTAAPVATNAAQNLQPRRAASRMAIGIANWNLNSPAASRQPAAVS